MKFTVDPVPEYSPGMCRHCGGASDRKWFLNLGYQEDFYGHVYFCNSCVDEMATVAGYIPATKLDEVRKEYEAQTNQLLDMEVYVAIVHSMFGSSASPNSILQFLDPTTHAETIQRVTEAVERRETNPDQPDPIVRSDHVSTSTASDSLSFDFQ